MYLMHGNYPLNKRAISCIWKRNCSLLTGWSAILVTFFETLVMLRTVTPSPMLIDAPIFKHTRISTSGKERRSRLGEKLNPQFQSSVSIFDDYCCEATRLRSRLIQVAYVTCLGFLCPKPDSLCMYACMYITAFASTSSTAIEVEALSLAHWKHR